MLHDLTSSGSSMKSSFFIFLFLAKILLLRKNLNAAKPPEQSESFGGKILAVIRTK